MSLVCVKQEHHRFVAATIHYAQNLTPVAYRPCVAILTEGGTVVALADVLEPCVLLTPKPLGRTQRILRLSADGLSNKALVKLNRAGNAVSRYELPHERSWRGKAHECAAGFGRASVSAQWLSTE